MGTSTMKNILKVLAFFIFIYISLASSASAACVAGTCFGIATGNWGTAGTWSATSGGVTCVCTPTTGDNIVFDAGSNGKSFHVDAAYSIGNLTGSGASTATIDYNSGFTVTLTGTTFTLLSSMTFTAASSTRVLSFNPASGTLSVTTAGKTLGSIIVNGTAGTTVQLQDDMTYLSGGSFTVTQATFDANNHNLTGGLFSSSNANTRTITLGNGIHTFNLTAGTLWDTTTTTGLTMTANTATLLFSAAANGLRGIVTGGLNFNGSTFSLVNSATTVPASISITGAGTANLLMTAPLRVTFGSSTTFTVPTAFTIVGTAFNNIISISTNDTNGTATTISVASGAPSFTWTALQGMTFTGGATFTATNSFDLKGNTGITITGPSGGGGRIIGG